ncbi:hypothetical protein Tco_0061439 [Tanacetum coccineum]
MSLQQTFKSSMTWLRPHHTRLGGHDEVGADLRSRPLEQTSGADIWSRPLAQTSRADLQSRPLKQTSRAGLRSRPSEGGSDN